MLTWLIRKSRYDRSCLPFISYNKSFSDTVFRKSCFAEYYYKIEKIRVFLCLVGVAYTYWSAACFCHEGEWWWRKNGFPCWSVCTAACLSSHWCPSRRRQRLGVYQLCSGVLAVYRCGVMTFDSFRERLDWSMDSASYRSPRLIQWAALEGDISNSWVRSSFTAQLVGSAMLRGEDDVSMSRCDGRLCIVSRWRITAARPALRHHTQSSPNTTRLSLPPCGSIALLVGFSACFSSTAAKQVDVSPSDVEVVIKSHLLVSAFIALHCGNNAPYTRLYRREVCVYWVRAIWYAGNALNAVLIICILHLYCVLIDRYTGYSV